MQRKIYDAPRMATCQGLPRLMKKLGLLQKHKTKRKSTKELISLGSHIKYDMVYDQACLERIIVTCGSIVTPVEGVLTNEVLFQHATEWASALRAGLFPRKLPFTAPGKGAQKANVKNKIDKTKKSVAKSNAPYSVKHFVRKQALWLIGAHQDLGTCQVDYSQMTLEDLKRLMPDSSNSLSKVGLSHKATVFQVVEGMDPLVIATFLCLFLPLEKKPSHLSAITNPANHELALRLIKEYESRAGVPPPPSWLAKELAEGQTKGGAENAASNSVPRRRKSKKTPVLASPPLPQRWPVGSLRPAVAADGNAVIVAPAKPLAHGKRQEVPVGDRRPGDPQTLVLPLAKGGTKKDDAQDGHDQSLTWHKTDLPPQKKYRKLHCSCKGNCRAACPGRMTCCPNVPVINLPGMRSDVLGLPSSDADTETQRDRHTETDTQPLRHTDTVTQTQTQAHTNPDAWGANQASSLGEKTQLKKVWRPLCDVCRCQMPGCRGGTRKPHGADLVLSNCGFCQKHWNTK